MDFNSSFKIDYKMSIKLLFLLKRELFLKKKTQLQIEISGFVKTCDEPLPNQLKVVKSNNNL
jgi:hypothetical protein